MTLIEEQLPKWRKLYEIAVLETNPKLLKLRATEAEEAVKLRQKELRGSPDSHEEKAALERSLQGLKSLNATEWAK
jgi:hypothetical protein